MMMKFALCVIGIVVLGASLSEAQSNAPLDTTNSRTLIDKLHGESFKVPLEATNWGKAEQGVRLLIYTTNVIFKAGSSITALTIITNGSSAHIFLEEAGFEDDFDLFLTNSAGRYYHLTPPRMHMSSMTGIASGTESAMMIPVRFRANIAPGDYLLIATRYFTLNKADFRLESNPLKIQVN
jgi:hypothetical protein